MPREPRHIEAGTLYHLISRFVDREWFIKQQDEREHYLHLLGRALERSDWRLYSYAVMSNHIHLALRAGSCPLDSWIRRVHAPFADAMNRAYDRIGVMFVRGPKAYPVPPAALGSLVAYIHNNPVRAGVVPCASDSTWTSHRAFVGAASTPPWLHVSQALARIGLDPPSFDAWVMDPEREASEHEFTEESHEAAIRLQCVPDDSKVVASAIIEAVAAAMGVPVTRLCSRARGQVEVLGRAVAVHCGVALGLTGPEIARALRASQQGVSVIRRRPPAREVVALTSRVLAIIAPRAIASGTSSD